MLLLGYNLGSKNIQVYMCSSLASLIEGYWCTIYVFLFVIGDDPYNIYALLYGTP